jgi:glutaredoxin
MTSRRRATLYRVALPGDVGLYGLRARHLLEAHGFEIDEQLLRSREAVDAFKADQDVATTPVVFIGQERIVGCHDLERYLAEGDTCPAGVDTWHESYRRGGGGDD